MDKILAYLTSVPAWYLATSIDGQPHVRPFSFAAEEGGHLWFLTARHKDVWEELSTNPHFEACSWWPGHGWLVLKGRAVEGEVSENLRVSGYEHLLGLGEHYDGAHDSDLVFFFVEALDARIDNHDGTTEHLTAQDARFDNHDASRSI